MKRAFDPGNLRSLAAGSLLAAAFLSLLPAAFKRQPHPDVLFAIFLAGLIFFFLLSKDGPGKSDLPEDARSLNDATKSALDLHDSAEQTNRFLETREKAPLWAMSARCAGDGVLIASAFMAGVSPGLVASSAILVHEVSLHAGELAACCKRPSVMRRDALRLILAGLMGVSGGLGAVMLIGSLSPWVLQVLLVLTGSRFVYPALTDLVPRLQHRMSIGAEGWQIAWFICGIVVIAAFARAADLAEDYRKCTAEVRISRMVTDSGTLPTQRGGGAAGSSGRSRSCTHS